jgi:hypothetical protein
MLVVPHLTWQTRASTPIFLFLLFTTLPLLLLLPLRLTIFLAGVVPFLITHPFMRRFIFTPDGGLHQFKVISIVSSQLQRILNEVSLAEKHIEAKGQSVCLVSSSLFFFKFFKFLSPFHSSIHTIDTTCWIIHFGLELREIEVFQNERWARPSSSATSAANGNVIMAGWKHGDSNLKPMERRAWTREPDGSQAVGDDRFVFFFFLFTMFSRAHLHISSVCIQAEEITIGSNSVVPLPLAFAPSLACI